MPFKDCEYLNDLRLNPVHDPVMPLDDLANAGTGKFRHGPPHLGELRQSITALNDSMDELFGGRWVGPSDEILDLDEAHKRLLRPDDLQG